MQSSKVLADILTSTIATKAHFDSWWALAIDAKGDLKVTMNRHADYFVGAWDAHYTSFFVNLAHLYDRRVDSSSIPTYLNLKYGDDLSPLSKSLQADFSHLADRARPLLLARHKTVAHVDAKLTEKDVFELVNMTWEEIRHVVQETVGYVAKLHGVSSPGEIGIPRDGRLQEAVFKVIRALQRVGA